MSECKTQCMIGSTEGCCWCLDTRLFTTRWYDRYVDGEGWVKDATRDDRYCASCKSNLGGGQKLACPRAPASNRDLYERICGVEFPPVECGVKYGAADRTLVVPRVEAKFWERYMPAEWEEVKSLSLKNLVREVVDTVQFCESESKMNRNVKNKLDLSLILMRWRYQLPTMAL